MKRLTFCICILFTFIFLINAASALPLFQFGDIDGPVIPTIGADEFAADNQLYFSALVIGFGPLPSSTDFTSVSPGYLSNKRLGDIVTDGRKLTDATPSFELIFELTADYTDMVLSYGRYGSESDILVTELFNGGNPYPIVGSAENNYQDLDFSFGDVSAGVYKINIDYLGGGAGNGHYIDYIALDGTAAPVPEPATLLLLGTGLIGLAGLGRKKLLKK